MFIKIIIICYSIKSNTGKALNINRPVSLSHAHATYLNAVKQLI